ncbi:MAG: ATP-binding cassette domain-containing protein [Bacteroidota bacterium]
MITFENITKYFQDKTILDDVSGHFDRGQVNLVIGTSGAGKSLLIKCIIGLIQPEAGLVTFDGRSMLDASRKTMMHIRREIGILFQSSALFDAKNVEENVVFPLDMLTSMSVSEKLDRANFCLERVGLKNANKKMPAELSGGMRKRVGIARAIVNSSRYLFCDEPNSGLDPKTALRIDELIKELTYEYNITTVVVTHDMDSVVTMGDSILFLDQGRKAWEGNSTSVLQADVEALQDFLLSSKLIQLVKQHAVTVPNNLNISPAPCT